MSMDITIKELIPIVSKVNIIDIRSNEQYNNRHIPSAKNIPSKNLIANPSKYLNKSEIYYIYCQRGVTSKSVCNILRNQGYKVKNILGGYEAWVLEN